MTEKPKKHIALPGEEQETGHLARFLKDLEENPIKPTDKQTAKPLEIKTDKPSPTEQRLLADLTEVKNMVQKRDSKKPREPRTPSYNEIANIILAEQPIITDKNTDLIFLYSKTYGYFECMNAIPTIKVRLQELIGEDTRINLVREVIETIRRKTYKEIQRFDQKQEYVCLNNGILNLRTMEVEKHDPTRFISYRVPVEKKKVDQESWLHYVENIVHKDDLQKLQESIGNVFANHYETKKLIFIYGGNDSGKSTFLEIFRDFLGENNCSHLNLMQLTEKFTNAQLYGKRANIFADIPYKIRHKNYGLIKNFTGGDPVTIQFKGKDAFSYRSIAKQFFSANGIPLINQEEADDAFYRRWEFIRFPHSFDPDPSIFKRYTEPEMKSALLLWALEGYTRLKTNNWKLTNQTTIDEAREKFEGVALEPTALWLLENCIPDFSAVTSKKILFENCKEYHQRKCLPFVDNYDAFCKWLKNQRNIQVLDYKPQKDDKREPSFVGIKLKPK